MAHPSSAHVLVPHTLRVLGHATPGEISSLRALPRDLVEEHLEDERARGHVTRASFGGRTTWRLTPAGRAKGEADLAEELDEVGGRPVVLEAHAAFLPLNRRLGRVMTQWQVRPTAADPMARNDHTDPAHDEAVVQRLGRLRDDLAEVTDRLTGVLDRFGIHQPRVDTALRHVRSGSDSWVDAPDVPSLNIVWIQLHEDLLATLGVERGQDDPQVGTG